MKQIQINSNYFAADPLASDSNKLQQDLTAQFPLINSHWRQEEEGFQNLRLAAFCCCTAATRNPPAFSRELTSRQVKKKSLKPLPLYTLVSTSFRNRRRELYHHAISIVVAIAKSGSRLRPSTISNHAWENERRRERKKNRSWKEKGAIDISRGGGGGEKLSRASIDASFLVSLFNYPFAMIIHRFTFHLMPTPFHPFKGVADCVSILFFGLSFTRISIHS